ncbi:hypothetical protein [Mucilaginibacter glaciei]|uniref:Uncharacterized protein n=1 Tax=Mucilaginibacter glaciei TaxID=2772109 RepID=A0A926NVX3_9SPHI|nr:hypothetical protein [Mucilaginibacter glaciei]MBD1392773.1 hypothetical protein [Mucilaginibacter glaciei]
MITITVDLLHDKALNLLRDLEAVNLIKLHSEDLLTDAERVLSLQSLKGKMTKQSVEEIERQLAEFREE